MNTINPPNEPKGKSTYKWKKKKSVQIGNFQTVKNPFQRNRLPSTWFTVKDSYLNAKNVGKSLKRLKNTFISAKPTKPQNVNTAKSQSKNSFCPFTSHHVQLSQDRVYTAQLILIYIAYLIMKKVVGIEQISVKFVGNT